MFNNISNVGSSYFIAQLKENDFKSNVSLRENPTDTVQLSTSPAFKGQVTTKVAKEGTKAIVKKLPVVLAAIAGFLVLKVLKTTLLQKKLHLRKMLKSF